MTCEIRTEAYSLLAHLRDLAAPNTMTWELRQRVDKFMKRIDTVSEIGIHIAGDLIYFDPQCLSKNLIPAKIVASYATADGRVLYDIAVRFGFNEDGSPRFAETTPLRDVVPSFIRSKEEGDILLKQQAEISATSTPASN